MRKSIKLKSNSTKTSIVFVVYALIVIGALVGEVKCIIKMVQCNWEPIGKAEIIYTAGTFTGLGCIIGYLDIQDK
jgi:hypothetical protein